MKVVFFVTGLDSGGLENYLFRFLKYKASSFSELTVYCKGGKGGQLEEDYKKLPNVKIVKSKISFYNPWHYIKLISYFKAEKFDAVCDFTGNFAGAVLFCAKKADINKRIVFYRGATDHFVRNILKSKYNDFVKSLTYNNATYILSNSQAAFDYFFKNKQLDNRFQVIYNGIDAGKFEVRDHNLRQVFDIPQNAFIIGHTGRFNEAKNHYVIVKVAQRLIRKYNDIYFILCGNGVKEGLAPQIEGLGIGSKVRLFENRRDIPDFLNTMDAFFFPSVTEGQPNALIEAMIMGLPFVASNIPSIKETVRNEEKLFAPGDVDSFTAALENLYLTKARRDINLKEETIRRFHYKERFDEFYNKLS